MIRLLDLGAGQRAGGDHRDRQRRAAHGEL